MLVPVVMWTKDLLIMQLILWSIISEWEFGYFLFVLIMFTVSTGHCLKPCVLLRFHWDEKMIEFCHSSQNECCHSPWKKLDPASYLKLHDIIHLHRDKTWKWKSTRCCSGLFLQGLYGLSWIMMSQKVMYVFTLWKCGN